MKIFNIDAFAQPKRAIEISGVKHPIRDLSVQQFIDNLKAAEELEGQIEKGTAVTTMIVELNRAVDNVVECIPSLERSMVASWSPDLVAEVMRFVRGDMDKEIAADAAEGEQKNAAS